MTLGIFDGVGIRLSTEGNNVLECNFIGTDPTGSLDRGNENAGVFIAGGSSNNRIGGTTPLQRNLLSGNAWGVYIDGAGTSGNEIQGNYIGTDGGGPLPAGQHE